MTSPTNNYFSDLNNRWMIVLIGLLLLVVMGFVGFGFYANEKYHRIASPLNSSLTEIKREATEAHVLIEKMLDGGTYRDIKTVWFELDQALNAYWNTLETQRHALESILPFDRNLNLADQNENLREEYDAYKAAVEQKLKENAPADHDYEHRYVALLARLDNMAAVVDLVRQKDLQQFRLLLGGGIGVIILLASLIAATVRRYEKQKKTYFASLNRAQDELEAKIKAQALTEEALQQSHNLFRTVFETSPDMVVITRVEDNIIVDVNHGLFFYTGYDRGEVIGRSVLDLDIWQELDQRRIFLGEVLGKGFADNWEAVLRAKNGDLLTCLLSSKKVDINGELHILTVARDITELKRTEKRGQAANTFLRMTNRHTKMQILLKEFIAEVKKLAHCSAAAVRIMDEEGRIPYAEFDGFSPDFCSLENDLSIHADKGMCVLVMRNETRFLAPYFTQNGSYFVKSTSELLSTATEEQKGMLRNTCHRYGYESLALIPIRSGNTTIGLIHIADRQAGAITSEVVDILESAALQLGTAIKRVCAEQGLKEAYSDLEDRVRQRTELLSRTNDRLLAEIETRKKKEQELLGYQQRLRHLSSELLQTEERERRRIAVDIHDRIGQALAVTKIQLGALKAEVDSQDLKTKIDDIRGQLTQTIRDTRTLTFELSPPILYELGLQAALEWLAEIVRKQGGLDVKVTGDGSDQKLDAEKRVLLFRTCRELLLNVMKHAGANSARIALGGDGELIIVNISDDGKGFEPDLLQAGYDPFERGFGLFSIREQLQHYGGTFEVESALDRGSTVTIVVPLETATEPEEEVTS